jgi:hypothetical protein
MTVKGMDTVSTAIAAYALAILSGGGSLIAQGVFFLNLGFTTGGLVSATGNALLDLNSCNFTTLVSTSGNGSLFGSTSSSANITCNAVNSVFANVSAPIASKGGLVNIPNTTSGVRFTNISGILLRVIFFIFYFPCWMVLNIIYLFI